MTWGHDMERVKFVRVGVVISRLVTIPTSLDQTTKRPGQQLYPLGSSPSLFIHESKLVVQTTKSAAIHAHSPAKMFLSYETPAMVFSVSCVLNSVTDPILR